MNSVVEDIKDMLLAETSLALVFGVSLHVHMEPASPDNTVTIFETPGMPQVGTFDINSDTKPLERPSIQVLIRNKKSDVAFTLAYEIISRLQKRSQEVRNAYKYGSIIAVSNPHILDWDTNGRIRVVVNFNIQRRLI